MGMGLPGTVAQTLARLITPSLGDDEDWVGMR